MIIFDLQKELSGSQGKLQLVLKGRIAKGQFITLSGDSGVGKTTFLRMIAGLTDPDQGTIAVNDKTWYNGKQKTTLKPQQRSVALVFQDLALFPNMTAEGNIQFASNNKGQSDIDELISIMELGELRNRKPGQLSRGQQQRVAIARAIAQDPQILLLDEPFSALDTVLKSKLLEYLEKVHHNYNLTTILVTHNPQIAQHISDETWQLSEGKICTMKTPTSSQDSMTVASVELKDGKYVLTIDGKNNPGLEAGMKLRKI